MANTKWSMCSSEAARVLHLDQRTVRAWVEKRKIKSRRDHRGWFWFDPSEVEVLARRHGLRFSTRARGLR